ncbi:hypothetical protein SMICM17S_11667 [Streptomyces microflavus]
MEYDGWDSSRQTYLEAKNGYDSYLSQSDPGTLTPSGKAKFLAEARAQVERPAASPWSGTSRTRRWRRRPARRSGRRGCRSRWSRRR